MTFFKLLWGTVLLSQHSSTLLLSNRLKTSDSLYVSCPAMVHRVAVIGTGSSGLACAKACVDEGLEPICFERGHDIGGVWNFKVSGDETRIS